MCNLGYVNTKVDCNVRRHTRDSSISRHKSDTPRQHKTHTSRSESKATDRRVRTRLKPGEGLPRSQHPPQVPPSPETPAPPHPAAPPTPAACPQSRSTLFPALPRPKNHHRDSLAIADGNDGNDGSDDSDGGRRNNDIPNG